MDRLPALIAIAFLALCACENAERRASVPTARLDAVTASPTKKTTAEAFCDVFHRQETAPALELPKLAAGSDGEATTGWRWYNLWATWCKPCVEEIPTLRRWRQRFGGEGKPVELVFLSVDTTDEAIETFREAHPGTPPTMRVADADRMPSWLLGLGLEEDTAIPIHVFAFDGRLRCVRTGALASNHYEAVSTLLSQ